MKLYGDVQPVKVKSFRGIEYWKLGKTSEAKSAGPGAGVYRNGGGRPDVHDRAAYSQAGILNNTAQPRLPLRRT